MVIFFILLGIFIFFTIKSYKLNFLRKFNVMIPLTFKEKEVIKNYYGTNDLRKIFFEYSLKILSRLFIIIPLIVITLIFYKSMFIFLIPVFIWGYKYEYIKLKNLVYKRKIEFYKVYPGFLNSLKLYLESGLSLENSLKFCFKDGVNSYYLSFLEKYLLDIKIGINRKKALIDIISLSRERVVINLLNYLIHFLELGNKDLGYLDYLIEEAWKLKKETIKKLAEEASAKMVFPMMLIFIGVLILVIVPSISSFGSMNLF